MQSNSASIYNNSLPWYHSKLTRDDVVNLFNINGKTDGLFLVTDSILDGNFILYLCHDDLILDYRISCCQKLLSLDNICFYETLEDLINHYRNNFNSSCILQTKLEGYIVKTRHSKLIPWRKIKVNKFCNGKYNKILLGEFNRRKITLTPIQYISDAKIIMDKCVCHENLVNIMGITTDEDEFFLISIHLQDRCLQEYLKSRRKKRISNNAIACCAYDISCGMRYLETLLICHKQLATRNIFINRLGIVKIGNFGLGEELLDDDKSLLLRWTAPEAIRTNVYNSKSDVWSYSICLWEISTCARLPYEEIDHQDVYGFVESGYRLAKPKNCTQALFEIIEMCWKWTANERPTFYTINSILEGQRNQRFSHYGVEVNDVN